MLPVSPIKMRVLCSSSKAKIKTFASALGEAFYTQAQNVPPAYPCEKERLVLLVISLNGAPNDQLRRFCSELTPARAYNVALVLTSPGFFSGSKLSLEERTAIVRWAQKIIDSVKTN